MKNLLGLVLLCILQSITLWAQTVPARTSQGQPFSKISKICESSNVLYGAIDGGYNSMISGTSPKIWKEYRIFVPDSDTSFYKYVGKFTLVSIGIEECLGTISMKGPIDLVLYENKFELEALSRKSTCKLKYFDKGWRPILKAGSHLFFPAMFASGAGLITFDMVYGYRFSSFYFAGIGSNLFYFYYKDGWVFTGTIHLNHRINLWGNKKTSLSLTNNLVGLFGYQYYGYVNNQDYKSVLKPTYPLLTIGLGFKKIIEDGAILVEIESGPSIDFDFFITPHLKIGYEFGKAKLKK